MLRSRGQTDRIKTGWHWWKPLSQAETSETVFSSRWCKMTTKAYIDLVKTYVEPCFQIKTNAFKKKKKKDCKYNNVPLCSVTKANEYLNKIFFRDACLMKWLPCLPDRIKS